nr:hypothetical protein CFP56_49572 [Quercus suber]
MSEVSVRSREEDDVLQRSTKKVKENHRDSLGQDNQRPISVTEGRSYRDKLVGECTGVFEKVFDVENVMETEPLSDDEANEDLPGETTVHLSVGKMECIDLGNEFFLIRFSIVEDRARVLKGGPWFVGGHYLSIRCWEPNFMVETAKLSAVAVWIRLPGLPIEYYEPSVLRDIGLAIGPVNFDKPIVKLIKIGGIRQPMQYEGINALCFSCGRVGHKTEGCPYRVKMPEQVEKTVGDSEAHGSHELRKDHVDPDSGDFGPWVLVARNRKPRKNRKLGLNKENHLHGDVIEESVKSAENYSHFPNREKSSSKQKFQKGKALTRGHQYKKNQAETSGQNALRQKAPAEWRVVNSNLLGQARL